MKSPVILKPKKPVEPQVITTAETPNYFQALGVIVGDVNFDEEEKSDVWQTAIAINGKQYPLYPASGHRDAFLALKKEVSNSGSKQRLLVYPKVIHFPKRDQPYILSFQLLAFNRDFKQLDLNDFDFKLAGIWQNIPVCAQPCISVFKNFNEERLAYVKTIAVEQKVRFMKATHIPVQWLDAPVKPFRFNPRLEKEQQGKASFVAIKARFSPDKDVFNFVALRSLPSESLPKFFKAGKKDKADALSKRGRATTDRPVRKAG